MKIAKHAVVSIHYTLADNDKNVIDSSVGDEPLTFLSGVGNIIPGLDDALQGCVVGDKKRVVVQPEQGYGEFDETLVQKLPSEMFSGVDDIQLGMEFQTESPDGSEQFVVVSKVEDDGITVDGNHELAGMVLNFDVTIEDVRDATASEIEHGHAH